MEGMPALVLAGDFTVKPGWKLGPRTLRGYEIVYFPYGSATKYVAPDGEVELSEPCVVITRPDEEHECQFDRSRPVRHLFVLFHFPLPEGKAWFAPLLETTTCVKLDADSSVPVLFKLLLGVWYAKGFRWEARCSTLLCSIMEELRGITAQPTDMQIDNDLTAEKLPAQVHQALHLMRTGLDQPFSVEKVARRIGWSHAYFTRVFTQCLGVAPNRYMNHLRMDKACQLLLYSSLSIKEVADQSGFANEHYFSRLFTKIKGLSATAFRERYSDPRFKHLAETVDQGTPYPLNRYFRK
ncbi:MAG: DNA-binding protein AraC-type [Paenibacillaceae bacterium]|jgi:AraC-like DNA-binding protein|nr:DNA-binding protein AraC-type [Paenibacillaceae bacterium]